MSEKQRIAHIDAQFAEIKKRFAAKEQEAQQEVATPEILEGTPKEAS